MSNPFTTKDPLTDVINQVVLGEKKLTDAELKKREEIVLAIKRENPDMEKSRAYAIATAQAKKVAEEVDQIDEISPETLQSYRVKAKEQSNRDYQKVRAYPFSPDKGKPGKGKEMFNLMKKVDKRVKGVDKASERLGKTRFEEEFEVNEAEDQQQNLLLRAMAQDPSDLMKMKRALKAGDKALTNPILRQEILKMLDQMMNLTTTDKSLLQRTRMGFQKAKTMKMPEEVQLEAIGAKDKQDEGEYGYEGDMAMSQLRTIIRNSEEMMKVLKKETDLPEWVQSKITLATDYLQTANDYLMSELEEEVEQIDEAKKTTHEDPLITVHKDGRLQAHAHLSTINDIHGTNVKHTAIHAGGAKVKTKYGDNLEYKLSRHHEQGVEESVAKDAPFEGGREVKSTKSAAERVKKIAKGMEKHYNKDKK